MKTEGEKVEAFATHLFNVLTPNDSNLTNALLPTDTSEGKIRTFTPLEIASEIDQLNVKKTPRADNITSRILRELPKKEIVFLTYLWI